MNANMVRMIWTLDGNVVTDEIIHESNESAWMKVAKDWLDSAKGSAVVTFGGPENSSFVSMRNYR